MTVVLVSIDGLASRSIDPHTMPHLVGLGRTGASCFQARTVSPPITLPAHLSMVRGIDPTIHGVVDNGATSVVGDAPSVLQAARDAGRSTAVVQSWPPLELVFEPTAATSRILHDDGYNPAVDQQVTDTVCRLLAADDHDLIFAYLVGPDLSGHEHGWDSDRYRQDIAGTDQLLGRIVAATRSDRDSVVVTTDHGGVGRRHGVDRPEVMDTFVVVRSPEVDGPAVWPSASILDIAPTVAELCRIEADPRWQGRSLIGHQQPLIETLVQHIEQMADHHYGEHVTMKEHALQTATAAQESGADDTMVVAALLHDIGHLWGAAGPWGLPDHAEVAGRALQALLPPAVIEPIRLHVAAKRWLVADDPTYQAQLSDASKVTLDQQGGPFSADQSAAFLARPFSSEAVALRRFDDAGKDPDHVVPDLDHFLPLVEEVLTSARWMPAGPPQTASSATDRDSDSAPAALSGAWVRDACRCPKCRDSGNDQHLLDVCDLVDRDGRSHWRVLTVDQSCDPSVIEVEHQATGELHRCLVPRRAWRPASKSKPAAVDGKSWNGDHVRARDRWTTSFDSSKWVDEVSGNTARFGLARLTGVPCTSGMVLEVAGQLGYVRVTNYGDLFEVRTEPNPENLAYTTLGLPLHTDNPYREPCPGVQLLHCLQPSAEGGASLLADGFAAAELLRDVDGTAFDLLASTPVRFRFHRDQPGVEKVDLQTVRTIVELDADRRLRAVNVNHRSMEVPTPTPGVDAFYSAYRRLVGILSSPEFMIEVALEAGDLIVFDNRRVLHGRTGFASSSPRHLQGCYIDMDAVRSRARTAGPT